MDEYALNFCKDDILNDIFGKCYVSWSTVNHSITSNHSLPRYIWKLDLLVASSGVFWFLNQLASDGTPNLGPFSANCAGALAYHPSQCLVSRPSYHWNTWLFAGWKGAMNRAHGATTRFWFITFYSFLTISTVESSRIYESLMNGCNSRGLKIFLNSFGGNYITTVRNAFALNLIIATTLKRLSAVAFVIIGIVKVWMFGCQQ